MALIIIIGFIGCLLWINMFTTFVYQRINKVIAV